MGWGYLFFFKWRRNLTYGATILILMAVTDCKRRYSSTIPWAASSILSSCVVLPTYRGWCGHPKNACITVDRLEYSSAPKLYIRLSHAGRIHRCDLLIPVGLAVLSSQCISHAFIYKNQLYMEYLTINYIYSQCKDVVLNSTMLLSAALISLFLVGLFSFLKNFWLGYYCSSIEGHVSCCQVCWSFSNWLFTDYLRLLAILEHLQEIR